MMGYVRDDIKSYSKPAIFTRLKISSQTPSRLNFQLQFFHGCGVRGIPNSVHIHSSAIYTEQSSNTLFSISVAFQVILGHFDVNIFKSLDFQWQFFRNMLLNPSPLNFQSCKNCEFTRTFDVIPKKLYNWNGSVMVLSNIYCISFWKEA